MDTIATLNEAMARIERIMRASMKAHEGMAELRNELLGEMAAKPAPKLDLSVLSKRRKQIFDLIADDVPLDEIAKRLRLSRRTVDAHQNQIRALLNLKTADELRMLAKSAKGTA